MEFDKWSIGGLYISQEKLNPERNSSTSPPPVSGIANPTDSGPDDVSASAHMDVEKGPGSPEPSVISNER